MTLFLVGYVAGLIGSLLGLGGGVVVVPSLIFLGFNVKGVVMLSIFATIATWAAASQKYISSGLVDFRVAFLLGLATSVGAFIGARLLRVLPDTFVLITFVLLLLVVLVSNLRGVRVDSGDFQLRVWRAAFSFLFMAVAGALSAILGIGAGVLKVFAMDRILKMPYRRATATSVFLIGITSSTSALYYSSSPLFNPKMATLVALGTLLGAFTGARLMLRLPVVLLRVFLSAVVLLMITFLIARITALQ